MFFVPALAFGYFSLSWFVNRLTVKLDARLLSAGHARLPVPGDRTVKLPVADIEQLYIDHEQTDNTSKRYYRLMVRYAGGRVRPLLEHHADLPALEALERALETALDIRDDRRMKLSPEGLSRAELSARLHEAEENLDLLNGDRKAANHQLVTARHKVLAAREALRELDGWGED